MVKPQILKENEAYQAKAARTWNSDRQRNVPKQKFCVHAKFAWENNLKRSLTYSRFYSALKMLSLSADAESNVEVTHLQNILELVSI